MRLRHWPECTNAPCTCGTDGTLLWESAVPLKEWKGRYDDKAMSAADVADELIYRNYRYNRVNSPNTPPEQWGCIYGAARIPSLERRYQLDPTR